MSARSGSARVASTFRKKIWETTQNHFEAARGIAEIVPGEGWQRWEAELSPKLEQWVKTPQLSGDVRKHFLYADDIR